MIITNNRKVAFSLGLLSTIIWWYTIILLTQTKVKIERRHYIGLCLGIAGFVLWFFKFSYTVESR